MYQANKIMFILFAFPLLSYAEESTISRVSAADSETVKKARVYRNPEERREAGLGRQLTNWLKVSGLLELEKEFEENNFSNNTKVKNYPRPNSTIQLGFEANLTEWLNAELIFETENGDHHRSRIDEAFMSAEIGNFGLELGKLTVPFGEFNSYFVTGPLLEFGETRKDSLILDYSFTDSIEVTSFAFKSEVKKRDRSNKYDWGAGINYASENEGLQLGASYLSDLAESDERFLREENDIYEKRVSAWSAYALLGIKNFELIGEVVQANNKFSEFDTNTDKPFAYNLELAYFATNTTQLAIRYERSDEFAEQPEKQYGVSVTWRPISNISITADYLHANFEDEFILNGAEEDLDDRDLIAIELTLEF